MLYKFRMGNCCEGDASTGEREAFRDQFRADKQPQNVHVETGQMYRVSQNKYEPKIVEGHPRDRNTESPIKGRPGPMRRSSNQG